MDKITSRKINKWIKDFSDRVKKKYKPDKILIFGSRLRGDNLLESDVDMLIVSKKFNGINWLERIGEVSQLWDGLISLDVLCYTPEEFEIKSKQICIVKEIAENGKIV